MKNFADKNPTFAEKTRALVYYTRFGCNVF